MVLSKKDAGAGLAFGAGATDALFGAGSGNVLTKVTKYAAGTFFVLALVLAIMQKNYHARSVSDFQKQLSQPGTRQPATLPMTTPAPTTRRPIHLHPSRPRPRPAPISPV